MVGSGMTKGGNDMKYKVVSSKELGVNCWLVARFLGGECQRYDECNYPEKERCKANPPKVERPTAS